MEVHLKRTAQDNQWIRVMACAAWYIYPSLQMLRTILWLIPRDDGQSRESDEMSVFQKYIKAQWSQIFSQLAKVLKSSFLQQKLEQELNCSAFH